ncbi:Lrp/AsnC family transcriptional regulator [Rhodococcus sp. SGAir0479]|uniref:Lrp/AsnC family transcriptional regulator n=1 Tax=Rhodococcus sp. SGAir0479 TaxID=2567884 RepID=UPI0010CCCE34|nr:Lrp/AsnC family transcriptional regulator [Rhodococcus sp. SGAir0479]QCQ94168.1 Lrp/AsnC family transcriptional regulator [Rhodococcus sp. SGAir0479]
MATTLSSHEPILTWLSAVRGKTSDLPHSARSVALAILTHVNPETGMTKPISYATLQQEAGCSRGTLVAALRRLDDAGMIRRFGAHQQLNVYSLAVDNSLASAVEPGTEFAPAPVQPLVAADHVGSDSAPTPVQILHHEKELFSSSSPSLSSVDPDALGTAAPIPLPRDWAPNPQHLSRVAARGLDLAAVVDAFRQYAEEKTRTGVDKWDKAFGWWLMPSGGWDKHVAARAAAATAPSVPASASEETSVKRTNHRGISTVMRTLQAQGISGASVRDRVVELLDEGTPVYEIAGMIENELFALPVGA